MARLEGIWIVEESTDEKVQLRHFFSALKNETQTDVDVERVAIPKLLSLNRVGEDKKEVTFNFGDLVQLKQPREEQLHVANVQPADNNTLEQYLEVLAKISNLEPEKKKNFTITAKFKEVN